ncbi:hypothetical protein C5167_011525 [Papaver somniferum]|uniref:Uncharacterized protein n=1 Tax=Papaver somniferum TaxID=3469 RepID=A0A4Y7K7B3_PAPSO|nr:hypothetical protein C5167_011525 [Papaver somniferum]
MVEIENPRSSQEAALSPVQCAAYLPVPIKVDLGGLSRVEPPSAVEVIKLETSFMSSHRPSTGRVFRNIAISFVQ